VTSFTCYGGVNEIGGNKILLEDQDTGLFLNFGMGFSLACLPDWEEKVQLLERYRKAGIGE